MESIKETKKIIEDANKALNEYNKKYYKDVLEFLNILFYSNSSSILSINITKLALSEDVFEFYNTIIDKYNLESNKFNTKLFFNEDLTSNLELYKKSDLMNICKVLVNNLLKKINYKADIVYFDSKPVLKIKQIY